MTELGRWLIRATDLRASSKMKVSGKQYSRRSFFPMSDVTARPTMRFSARRARLDEHERKVGVALAMSSTLAVASVRVPRSREREVHLLSIDFLAAFTSAFAVDASSTELSVMLEPPSLMRCSWRDRLSAKSVPGIPDTWWGARRSGSEKAVQVSMRTSPPPDIGGNEELWRSARSQLARSRSSSA